MSSPESENDEQSSKSLNDSTILEVPSVKGGNLKNDELASNNSTSVEGSVVASPSIESFSTFPDLEVSESNTGSRDLQVKVDSPQKHVETMETYITFRITTKTTRPEYEENEYVIRRRYNDFIWLRQKLLENFPTHIIPPMPGKHSLIAQLDRYSKEFILARMKSLHIFLSRVVNHPILSYDKNLQIFLTSKPLEFSTYRKNRSNTINKLSDSLQNVSINSSKNHQTQEFDQAKDYCLALSEKLFLMDKITKRIQKERQDYLSELHQLHPIFTQLSNSEPELSKSLQAISDALQINASAQQKLLESSVNEERDYIAYVDAVKEALARRDSIQNEFEIANEELSKKTAEKNQLSETGSDNSGRWETSFWKSESQSEKLERVTQLIIRFTKLVEVLQDRLESANENLRNDLMRWHIEKRKDLKNMLIAMADQQIEHYQESMKGWEDALTVVKTSNNANDSSS